MTLISIFLISFIFSFIGSIPPGSVNLSVISLSLEGKKPAAVRFALAAALVEYPYAWLALLFQRWMIENPWVAGNFHILSALVMFFLGITGLYQSKKKKPSGSFFSESGFRKGLLVGALNPLALPYWIGVSAWLIHMGWVALEGSLSFHFFALGVSLGTFLLLVLLSYIAAPLGKKYADNGWVMRAPSIILLMLGIYSLGSVILQ